MTLVLSLGSTRMSNWRQPGSLRAALPFSTHFFMNASTFSGLILMLTCSTNMRDSLFVGGRDFGADPLDDHLVVLRPAVRGEVEHGLLQIGGEIDVGVIADDLVLLGLALDRYFASRRDDERVAEHAKAVLEPCLGR